MRIAVVSALLVATAACSNGADVAGDPSATAPSATATPATPTATPGVLDEVVVEFDGARVTAEVADTAEERRRGLMGREELAPDAGMLFLFEGPSSGGFWMKDTLVPLSIAFLRSVDGSRFRVVSILEMEPCEADPCPTYDPETTYDAALEVDQGWFAEAGVEVGAEARVIEASSG